MSYENLNNPASLQPEMNIISLNVRPYLINKAKELFDIKLHSTVCEFDSGDNSFIKGNERRVGVVHFAVKKFITYTESVPEKYIIRWAKVLNLLADRNLWKYGILSCYALPLDCWGNGDVFTSENTKSFSNNLKIKGRYMMLAAYIGVPFFIVDDEYGASIDKLNYLVENNLFVKEGNLGNEDWTNLIDG